MKTLIALLAMTSLCFAAQEPADEPEQGHWELYGIITLPLKAFQTQEECVAFAKDKENAQAAFAHHEMLLDCREYQ